MQWVIINFVQTEVFTAALEKKPFDKEKIKNDGVYHIKQLVSNACGTIALIHSVANNLDKWVWTSSYIDFNKML